MGKQTSGSEEKGKSGFYETFDSGDGPTVADKFRDDFAHRDSKQLDESGPDTLDQDLKVPTLPQK